MSSLKGKLVSQTEIKSDGDVFHEIFRCRPHHISSMSPNLIEGADLLEVDWGTAGSVICWHYVHEGKQKDAKNVIEAIDESKNLVRFMVIESDLLEVLQNFAITVHVDTHGENNLVTWTFEYEKRNESAPDPITLMELCVNLTKDIEAHHLK